MTFLKHMLVLLLLILITIHLGNKANDNKESELKTVKLEFECFMANGSNFCNN